MKTKRLKIQIPTLATRADAEAAMNDLAATANNQRRIAAERDAAILKINQRYEASLAACALDLQTKTESLHHWAQLNPGQFPKGRKSLEMTSGTLGFRTGTPKLALVSRAWTWDKVLAAIKGCLWARKYLRIKEEVDKESIIADYSEITDDIGIIGVKITQEESFFIEPFLTEIETRQVSEAA